MRRYKELKQQYTALQAASAEEREQDSLKVASVASVIALVALALSYVKTVNRRLQGMLWNAIEH